ncbi:MAG TPA: hypothetical protein VF748_02060 [Candidatus Acidoferrum sp.]
MTTYVTYKVYRWVRGILATVLTIVGIVAIWLLASPSQGSLGNTFNTVSIIFWTVVPPAWFFFEYWIFDSEKLIERPRDSATNQPVAKERFLKSLKDYADYASKIWAAILAVLLFLSAPNMTSKKPSTPRARQRAQRTEPLHSLRPGIPATTEDLSELTAAALRHSRSRA